MNSITSNTALMMSASQDDHEDASDARLVYNTLVMRRQRSNASAKKILGVRPRTHYMTILTYRQLGGRLGHELDRERD